MNTEKKEAQKNTNSYQPLARPMNTVLVVGHCVPYICTHIHTYSYWTRGITYRTRIGLGALHTMLVLDFGALCTVLELDSGHYRST